jgi:beta-alanine--pyruvate transaminase
MPAVSNRSNELDLSHFWMPFTANRQFKSAPRLLESAHGMHYRATGGREIVDGTAGLWCVNAGHGRREIARAVHEQLLNLDYAPAFQMGHSSVFELATRLCKLAPERMNRVFFTNSGSESVDTALKIAFAYYRARGQAERTRVIGRERGYHGVGFGGISVGGIVNNRRIFPTLPSVDHLPHTHDARNHFSKGQPTSGAEKADILEQILALHGPETVAAVIIEPVAGSTGVLIPPQGYLERIREICTRHGILLIFDEVITGFGRLGTPFAAQFFGVKPDIITAAKGLTNGVIPMGAVFVTDEIYDAFMRGPEAAIEFFHGYTYSGNPAASAAALATLDIYLNEDLLTRAATLAQYWEDLAHGLKGSPHVIDVRNIGLVAGIELESRPGAPGARGYETFLKAYEMGVLTRYTGDTIALSPPLIVERAHIDQIFETLKRAILAIS